MIEEGVKALSVTEIRESEVIKVLEKPYAIDILETIMSKGKVKPVIGLETGIRYLEFEVLPNWREVLEELIQAKLVEKIIIDMVIACPRCESVHIGTRYHCRYCNSFHILFTEIIQHIICGYIDTKIKFKVENKQLTCPRCGAQLRREGIDYIILGRVFECRSCGRRMDKPEIKHVCRRCGLEFTIRDAKYKPVYAYRLSSLGEKIVSKGLHVRKKLISLLTSMGYQVEENAKFPGYSGIEHSFDILAKGETNSIAIDFIGGSEREASLEILSRTIKALDTGTLKYIVIVRSIPETVKKIVESQGIIVVEGYLCRDIEEKMKRILMS